IGCAGSRQDKNHPPSLKALIGHFFAPCCPKWAPCPAVRAARRGGSARRWWRYRAAVGPSDTRGGGVVWLGGCVWVKGYRVGVGIGWPALDDSLVSASLDSNTGGPGRPEPE